MYQDAYQLIKKEFYNKTDKAGKPYINHLLAVAAYANNEYEKTLGLLHDIFEETTITKSELLNLGFPIEMINKLILLTHNKNESYEQYIKHILDSKDINVLHIKKYDILNNLDPRRLQLLSKEKQQYFCLKYTVNLKKIEQTIKRLEKEQVSC